MSLYKDRYAIAVYYGGEKNDEWLFGVYDNPNELERKLGIKKNVFWMHRCKSRSHIRTFRIHKLNLSVTLHLIDMLEEEE